VNGVPLKVRAVSQALKSKGFAQDDRRDHVYYFFFHNGKKTQIYTKISHGQSEITDPLCSAMARQIKLTSSQFRDFVDCPLSLDNYLEVLVKSKYLSG
jgi:hypothetical protein